MAEGKQNSTEFIWNILEGYGVESIADLLDKGDDAEFLVDILDEMYTGSSSDSEYNKFRDFLYSLADREKSYRVKVTLSFETDNKQIIEKLFGDCEKSEKNDKITVILKKIDYNGLGSVLKKVPKKYVSVCRLYSAFLQREKKDNNGVLAVDAFFIDEFCEWLQKQLKITLPKRYFTYTYSFWDQSRGKCAGWFSDNLREAAKYILKNISVPSLKAYAEEAKQDIEEAISDYYESETEYSYCIQSGKRSYFRSGFGVEMCLERLQDAFYGENDDLWKPQSEDMDAAYNAIYKYASDFSIEKLRQTGIVPIFVSGELSGRIEPCASDDAWFYDMRNGEEFSLWLDEIDSFVARL